jgi:hypothetical protein
VLTAKSMSTAYTVFSVYQACLEERSIPADLGFFFRVRSCKNAKEAKMLKMCACTATECADR